MLSRGKARLFKKAELVLVNYRVHGETYVVDSVISKGILQLVWAETPKRSRLFTSRTRDTSRRRIRQRKRWITPMAIENRMSPASSPESPQGGKRLNRVALYIGLTAVTLFCITMAMVASDRATRQAAERAAAATKTGGDTEQFAKAVAANGDGWRKEPPAVAPTPPPTPTPVTLGRITVYNPSPDPRRKAIPI